MSKLVIPGVVAQTGSSGGGGGGGDSVIKDYEAPSYTVNTTLFTSPLPIPNLDALTEAGAYRVHFDMDMEGTTTTVTYIADVAPIKVSDTLFAYMQNLYVGPGGGDSVSIVRSGMLNDGAITWADWSGNSVADINTKLSAKLENTATGANSLTILGTATNQPSAINIGASSQARNSYCVAVGYSSYAYNNSVSIGGNSSANSYNTTAVGVNSQATGSGSSAFGTLSKASSFNSIAIGHFTEASANNAIQLGNNNGTLTTNSTADTLQVWDKILLERTTGKIPMARLPIVQISQADYDALVSGGTVDANTLYLIV